MLHNQALAQALKDAAKRLYSRFSQKYSASYPKGYNALLKIQELYTNDSTDVDELIKLMISAKSELKGGDAFRIFSASYLDLTSEIDKIINHFNNEKSKRAEKNDSQQQAATATASETSQSSIQKLMEEIESIKLDHQKQMEQHAAKINEFQTNYDDKFNVIGKHYTGKLQQKQFNIRQLDEANAKKIDQKALDDAQQQHMRSMQRKELKELETSLNQVITEAKSDADDNQSVRTALSNLSSFSNRYFSSKATENDLLKRFTIYQASLSAEQQKLAQIAFSLFNLLHRYDANGNLLASKKDLAAKPKTEDLQQLENAIEFLFNGNSREYKQFFKNLVAKTQDQDLQIKFRVIKRDLANISENLCDSDLKSLQKFIMSVYPQADKNNTGINHSNITKAAYNYGVDLITRLKQLSANEAQQQSMISSKLGL